MEPRECYLKNEDTGNYVVYLTLSSLSKVKYDLIYLIFLGL
jgi:hypothetical protein